jgi:gliding motility-associated-like protein
VKKTALFLILLLPCISYSQLDIVITTNLVPIYLSDGDTLSSCRDSMIIFEAFVTDGGVPVTNAEYYWDYDDGYQQSGTDLDSVSHIYLEIAEDTNKGGGGYRVKLRVIDESLQTGFTIIPIKVAIPPNYTDTKVNLPEEQIGICKGSTVQIIGKAVPDIWEDQPSFERTENPNNYFDDIEPYSSSITIDEFNMDSTYSTGDIDSIAISLIHTDMGNLKMTMYCEFGGDTLLLKDYSNTNHEVLGDTANNEPYTFYWSSFSSETMNSSTNFNNGTSYLPEESFNQLNGCSFDGNWTISIEDNQYPDSGFVYSWAIIYNEEILPPVWSFNDSLEVFKIVDGIPYGTFWTGEHIIGETNPVFIGDTISKSIQAAPDVYGGNGYFFNVVNNWGCPQDTDVVLTVEKISFTADPSSGEAKLNVKFDDNTSWAVYRDWDFGDKENYQDIFDTVSHKYLEKGTYDAILIDSDESGCTDSDTLTIEVSVEPSKLDNIPNIFSPNDDGFNEVYKFTEENLKGMAEFQITIYNRYGQKVFESSNYEQLVTIGWDGKTKPLGLKVSPGIYYYVIKAKGKDGILYKEKGSIHIFR